MALTGALLVVGPAPTPAGAVPEARAMLRVLARDDFNRSDRDLNGDTAPSGQTYRVTSIPTSVHGRIEDGAFVTPRASASYAHLDFPAAPTRIAIDFTFNPGSSADAGVAL